MSLASTVLGYHGCDESVARKLITGDSLWRSENPYDWLGNGIYFWQDSPMRAMQWAKAEAKQSGSSINNPAVIGAIIKLGNCLNLTDAYYLGLVKEAYDAYADFCKKTSTAVAANKGHDFRERYLDCAVFET